MKCLLSNESILIKLVKNIPTNISKWPKLPNRCRCHHVVYRPYCSKGRGFYQEPTGIESFYVVIDTFLNENNIIICELTYEEALKESSILNKKAGCNRYDIKLLK